MPTTTLGDPQRAELLAALERDVVSESTAVSRASSVRTWTILHIRWFGTGVPVVPLTIDSIRGVAAQMKNAGYRSFPNYVTALKAVHKKDFAWNSDLDDCRRECEASTQRGIGPARQALALPIEELLTLDLTLEPLVSGGPVCPLAWAVLSAFHVTRGAESACSLASSLTLCADTMTETWRLPVSKTDPQAVGCQRAWGCVCSAGRPRPCPYHAARDLRLHLAERFGGEDGDLPVGLPLFPTKDGNWCSRAGFVGTVARLAELLACLPPTTWEGQQWENTFGESRAPGIWHPLMSLFRLLDC